MKIILAPDKFKGSLSGLEFCKAVSEGIKQVMPQAEIITLPLADGGDGTIEVVNYYLKGTLIETEVHNPLFKKVRAKYLYVKASHTAFIEMAEASGLKLLSADELDCKNASTLGTGELILDAIERGAKQIILGIGGSATNDCGIGMATALGYRFLDKNNKELKPVGAELSKIVTIDALKVYSKLNHVNFRIACDVSNLLYGNKGAAIVYAKQKGASKNDIELLDRGLQDFSKVLDAHFKINSQAISGGGAAGGLGLGAMLFLNGTMTSGIDMIKEISQFDNKVQLADWIITGEGKLDAQTLSGKTIQGVIKSAKQHNIKVAAFCGAIDLDEQSLRDFGIVYNASVMDKAANFKDAIDKSYDYLKLIAREFSNYNKLFERR